MDVPSGELVDWVFHWLFTVNCPDAAPTTENVQGLMTSSPHNTQVALARHEMIRALEGRGS
jgi:hypothetical protein